MVADLETGTLRTLAERPPGVVSGWPDSDGRTVVWQESGEETWEVIALDIASGKAHVVATGTDTGPGAPQVAGNFVTVNRPRPGFGAVIEVHALADGRLLREIPVRDRIEIPDLDDDGTVVYTTGPFDEGTQMFHDNTLYVARPGRSRRSSRGTPSGPRSATAASPGSTTRPVALGDRRPGRPPRASRAHRLGVPNTGWQGAVWPDAGDDLVVWHEAGISDDPQAGLALATSLTGPILIRTPDHVIIPRVCGDWITWIGLVEGEDVFSGVPLSAIPTP